MRRSLQIHTWAAALCLLWLGVASAEEVYPSRPIRLIVSFPPGGSADAVARLVQPLVEKQLGQPLVVENRSGAGGVIGVDLIAKAEPDGYVIGLGAAGALAVNVSLNEKMPYDPQRDLAPVTRLAETPFILAAANSLAATSLRDVIARAKSKPESVSIGHGGNGTAMYLTAQLFNHMAGLQIPLVPYRGSGPVTADVAAGHIPLGITDIPSALAQIKAGQLKALAVSSKKRYPLMPDLPTFDEAGVPGFESIGWFGIVAPVGTPHAVIAKLNAAFGAALRDGELRDRVLALGADPTASTPDEFAAFIASEIAKWKRVAAVSAAKEN
jgi:tripartite-type tricarboxylate transporter receptor subunit TctC